MPFPIQDFNRSPLLSSQSKIEQNQSRYTTDPSAGFSAILEQTAATRAEETTSEISALVEEIDAVDKKIAALRTQLQQLQESGAAPELIKDEVNRINDELDSLGDERKMLLVELEQLQGSSQTQDKRFSDKSMRESEDDDLLRKWDK